MEQLKQLIIKKTGLTDNHFEQLYSFMTQIWIDKNDCLIAPGRVCDFIGFVNSGILRYYIDKGGAEFNIDFHLPGSFASAYSSFLTQKPAIGYLQALEQTELFILKKEKYEELLKASDDWYKLAKYISDDYFLRKCKRQTSLLTDSAKDRFDLLLNTYPKIEQLVPQYHIASYLGIKPESLSRIKSLTYIKK
ncbi:Crp/Fnr family transcriptional regulator [Sinomicrobium pectinilyticum]|uniref:Crp/Fnr family transcriptional regulator n=1 Tax=Sinomicrobium pectinilyticum TaxID=1084421 RepID=A0A3N0EZT3_SINP1|nr:Crp/Fnr family transcriptional regulator [Sinomicrobium pectinilyticum]RNL93396.1 Crp/Fnr family transcriptional regulator [Sinomicrobium pectinilyticum]